MTKFYNEIKRLQTGRELRIQWIKLMISEYIVSMILMDNVLKACYKRELIIVDSPKNRLYTPSWIQQGLMSRGLCHLS